jgi:hypothetical protein
MKRWEPESPLRGPFSSVSVLGAPAVLSSHMRKILAHLSILLVLVAPASAGALAPTAEAGVPAGTINLSAPSNGQILYSSQTVYSSTFLFLATFYLPFPSNGQCQAVAELSGPNFIVNPDIVAFAGESFACSGAASFFFQMPMYSQIANAADQADGGEGTGGPLQPSQPLQPGSYTWTVFVYEAGDLNGAPIAKNTASFTVVPMTRTATPTIVVKPPSVTSSLSATFSFSDSSPNPVSFECALTWQGVEKGEQPPSNYSALPTTCPSHYVVSDLEPGKWILSVGATGQGGSSSTQNYQWIITPLKSTPTSKSRSRPPAVSVLPSSEHLGGVAYMRYRASGNGGRVLIAFKIFRQGAFVALFKTPMHSQQWNQVMIAKWPVPVWATGNLRFCGQAWDIAGNHSAWSCASLRAVSRR